MDRPVSATRKSSINGGDRGWQREKLAQSGTWSGLPDEKGEHKQMDLPVSVNTVGSLITLGLGIFGLFWPLAAARLVGIEPDGERGISEIRATYGGIFLAIGLFATINQTNEVFRALGVGWLGAGAARSFSYVHDQSRSVGNLAAIVIEIAVGLSMLVPWDRFAGT